MAAFNKRVGVPYLLLALVTVLMPFTPSWAQKAQAPAGNKPTTQASHKTAQGGCLAALAASDHAKALPLCQAEARQGHAQAQYNLAVMYAKGQGVARDYTRASAWYRKAAEQGHDRAQFNLGVMY